MTEQRDPTDPRITGQTDHEQHRAPEGQGVRAPDAQDTGGMPQFSVFDGEGNEQVVVVEGTSHEGTGDTVEEARKDLETDNPHVGEGFNPGISR